MTCALSGLNAVRPPFVAIDGLASGGIVSLPGRRQVVGWMGFLDAGEIMREGWMTQSRRSLAAGWNVLCAVGTI
jgi:hypothetical protein